jgi:hypothetical protein
MVPRQEDLSFFMLRKLTAIAFIGVLFPAVLPAQETRGAILGRVTDASGAVIPGVTVSATNTATNVSVASKSTAEGTYEIPFLLPGAYRLTAELAGFKSFLRDGIEVRIADRVTVPIAMEIGQVTDRVTVTAETPLLESATASLGQVIDQRRVAELPIAHGNPYLLMTLSPGVAHTQNAGLDQPYAPTHIVGYAMDGVRANRSEITLDGAPNTALNHRWGAGDLMAGYTPPADVVQEFKVQTATFDASVGHSQGGITSITLKTGGNQLHGTAYYALQDPKLNSNLFFANRNNQPKAPYDYNRWGGSATGPVWLGKLYDGRDRTFFSYGYEGIDLGEPVGAAYGQGVLTVPTMKERAGDFSDLLALGSQYRIYDPATRAPAAGGRYTVQPFAGNIIPANRISPIAKNILSYYSEPNAAGTADGLNNLIRVNDLEVLDYYNHVARIDHNFSTKHRIYGRYNTYHRFSNRSDSGWFRNMVQGGDSDWIQQSFSFDDVYNFSPTTFLNLRYSFYRLQIEQTPNPASIGFDLTKLGFPQSYADAIPPDVRSFPVISSPDFLGTPNNWWKYPTHNQTVEGNFAAIKGAHTWRFGADARQYRNFQYEPHNASSGYFEFGTAWTRGPFDNSTSAPKGQGTASLLLGLPTAGRVDRKASFATQSTVYSLYVHDDWRVSRNLTLNLGLRYEIEGPITERFNRTVRGYDFATPSPLEAAAKANYANSPIPELSASQFRLIGGLTFAGVGGQPRTLFNRDTNNFMPRIGVAYSWGPKTVIRGGYGLFYGPLGNQRRDVIQLGFSQSTDLIPSIDNGMTFRATLENPFPDGILEPAGASNGLMTFAGRPVEFFNENPKAPLQQRWQIGVQRELPQRVLVELSYVGNYGSSLETSRSYRPLPLEYLSRSVFRDQNVIDDMTRNVPNPFAGLLPGTGLAGQSVARSYLLSGPEYMQFTSLTGTDYEGYSTYHSLQAKTERRFAAGWTLNAAYTWSKAMEATNRLNGYLSPLEYVISDQDRAHRVVVSGIWELPFGRGKRWANSGALTDKFVGGWQVQGVYTGQGGAPLNFGNVLYVGDVRDITLPAGQRTVERWFNTAGFERGSGQQLSFNYRTFPSRLSDVRSDGMNQWDLSVMKNTRFRERYNIQFRAEFLNAWNHANFAPPNTSPTSSAFGQVTAQRGFPRRLQMTTKFIF